MIEKSVVSCCLSILSWSLQKQAKDTLKIIGCGSALFLGYLTASGDERFYASSLMPVLQRFVGAETAHIIAVRAIGLGLVPYNNYKDPASLVSVLKICDKLLYGSVSQIDDTFP